MYFLKTVCCPCMIRQTDQRKRIENPQTFPSTYENVVYTKVILKKKITGEKQYFLISDIGAIS